MLETYNYPPLKHTHGITPWLANLRSLLHISTAYSVATSAWAAAHKINYFVHEKDQEPTRRQEMIDHFRFATRQRVRELPIDGQRYPATPVEFYTYLSAQNILDKQRVTEGQIIDTSDIPEVARFINRVLDRKVGIRAKKPKDVERVQHLLQYVGEARDYFIAIRAYNMMLVFAEVYHDQYKVGGMNPKTPGNVAGTITGLAAAAGLAALTPGLALAAPFLAHVVKSFVLENRAVTVIQENGADFETLRYVKEDKRVINGLVGCVNELMKLAAPDWLTPEQLERKRFFGKGAKIRQIQSPERREAFENAIIASLSGDKLYPLLRRAEFYAMRNQGLSY